MHITLETDYAIRIVDCLARNGFRMGAQSIAEYSGVTLRFSLKILRKLVSAGIIRSYKGAQGGYEIARPLEDISINNILEAIEGPYAFSRCLNEDHVCHRNGAGSSCVFHQCFEHLSKNVQIQLDSLTFDKLLQEDGAGILSTELVYSVK